MLASVLLTGGIARANTVGCGGPGPYALPCAPNPDVITVSPTTTSQPITPGFDGVSFEYGGVNQYEAPGRAGADVPLARLIDMLSPGQRPVLRIGGDSTDWTWWPVPGMIRPPGISDALSPAWAALAKTMALSTRARLILGINLEADNPAIGGYEASSLLNAIGRQSIGWFEIGNEPMLYPALPWYHTVTGTPQYGRSGSYNLAAYTGEFDRFKQALPRGVPLAGPSIGHSWVTQLGTFIQASSPGGLVTFHAYGINPYGDAFRGHNCSTAVTDPAHPTLATLLNPFASLGVTRDLPQFISMAHSRGLQFRIDEMNAVTCAGTPGVSNTFASALWTLNALLAFAQVNADGVNVHTWRNSAGRLFDFTQVGGHWVATVRPEYYGMLMFARAAPAGSQLLSISHSNSALQTWALATPQHTVNVVLINDSLTQAASADVGPAKAGEHATAQELVAPSAASTSGVSLDCQSFGTATLTGELAGPSCTEPLTASGGVYTVTLPPASAALLTIADPSAKPKTPTKHSGTTKRTKKPARTHH